MCARARTVFLSNAQWSFTTRAYLFINIKYAIIYYFVFIIVGAYETTVCRNEIVDEITIARDQLRSFANTTAAAAAAAALAAQTRYVRT